MENDPYQEKLDDPTLPFDLRWSLISEIDKTNHRFGIYKKFIKEWDKWASQQLKGQKKISVLEVGSGSGGLTLEIKKWAESKGLEIELHLYDAQEDVLNESLAKFSDNKPQIHIATDDHLKVYPEKSFDFIISLHVIHHIQPLKVAASAMEEMLRISKKGVFIVDLENKFLAIPFAKAWNKLTGVSPSLSEDGIKSIQRSHSPTDLNNALLYSLPKNTYHIDFKREFFIPYWQFSGCRVS